MLSFVWVLYLFLISLVVAFFTFVFFFRKGRIQDSTPAYQKIKFIKEHIPPTSLKGWRLKAVDNGLRVWQKDLSSTAPPWVPGTIYACSGIIPASLREVMNVLRQAGTSREWDPEVQQVLKVLTRTADHDVVSLSASCRGVIAKTVYCVREMFGAENSSVYSRFWNMKSKSEAWLISLFFEDVVPVEGDLWSCFLLSPLENDEDDQTESLLTLVVAPVSSLFASIPRLTSSRVAGLQDYFTHSKPVGSPHKSGGSEVSGTNQSSTSDASVEDLLSSSVTPSGITTEERGEVLPNATQSEHSVHSLGKSESSELITEDFQSPDLMESESNDELNRKLIEVYEATEETDGWALVGNVKGVDILKRPAPPGERPWDCLKGTSVVHVPIHYVLAYIYSLDYRGDWDDLYLKGEVVEEYDPLTKVSRMEYKPIWPASGRDFCNCVMLRELSEGLYGVASEAVVHEDCPERRGLVRGEIIIGGFVVKEISSDPPSCQVTYMTRVDLKGNLPARIVNRVTASQPQAVAVLREKLEALYKQDVESGGQEMSKIQQEGVDLWVNLMKVKEARIQASGGTPVSVRREEGAASEERASISGWSLADRSDSESLNLPPDVQEMLEASNMSEESEMFSLTEENMQLPFLDKPSHHVDYRTLANQTAANLMGELLLASKVEISMSEELNFTEAKEGEWSYQSIEKDVVILRKITPGEKIYSFLGKGMIKVKPPAVWQAVRNHMTRHVYDRMLKKTKLVKQIDEQTRIIYLHHETTQCFVKQSRDFVVLTTERVEPEKYVIAGTSIDIPQLPPTKNIVRGKVYASGWIIEPVLQQGQLFSMVSYLSQVDFGGAVPTRLLNMIARRQPLCIAYLRDYLEKFNK